MKPIALMRWLCKLICPPGGLIVDPFAGSGSTGIAAHLEGFRFVGIEQDETYAEIAERRIAHWSRKAEFGQVATKSTAKANDDELFGVGRKRLNHCPEHGVPCDMNIFPRRYKCGCAIAHGDTPVSTQERPQREQPPSLVSLPLFADLLAPEPEQRAAGNSTVYQFAGDRKVKVCLDCGRRNPSGVRACATCDSTRLEWRDEHAERLAHGEVAD